MKVNVETFNIESKLILEHLARTFPNSAKPSEITRDRPADAMGALQVLVDQQFIFILENGRVQLAEKGLKLFSCNLETELRSILDPIDYTMVS